VLVDSIEATSTPSSRIRNAGDEESVRAVTVGEQLLGVLGGDLLLVLGA
jgi:hypothetical protein